MGIVGIKNIIHTTSSYISNNNNDNNYTLTAARVSIVLAVMVDTVTVKSSWNVVFCRKH